MDNVDFILTILNPIHPEISTRSSVFYQNTDNNHVARFKVMGKKELDKSQYMSIWRMVLIITIIVRTFEICRESHVTKKLDYSCSKIRVVINSKLSVFLVRTTSNIYYKFKVE